MCSARLDSNRISPILFCTVQTDTSILSLYLKITAVIVVIAIIVIAIIVIIVIVIIIIRRHKSWIFVVTGINWDGTLGLFGPGFLD
jgi:hypothetical protein